MAPGNPILVEFLKDWYDTAKERDTKAASVYKRAWESMKACPIPFNHPSEASKLNGIGPKITDRLTKSLEAYCVTNGLPPPQKPRSARKRTTANALDDHLAEQTAPPAPKRRKTTERAYIPRLRSGAYAILIALLEIDQTLGNVTKQELIALAQPHCDASFEAPVQANKSYNAWSSMMGLVEKGLVRAKGHPKRYSLTEAGLEVAHGIVKAQREGGGERGDEDGSDDNDGRESPGTGGRAQDRPAVRREPSYDLEMGEVEGSSATTARARGRTQQQPPTRGEASQDLEAEEVRGSTTKARRKTQNPPAARRPRELSYDLEAEETEVQRRHRTAHMPANTVFERIDDEDVDALDSRSVTERLAGAEARRRRYHLMYGGESLEYGASRAALSAAEMAAIDLESEDVRRRVLSGEHIDGSRLSSVEPAARHGGFGGRPQTMGNRNITPTLSSRTSTSSSSVTVRASTTTTSRTSIAAISRASTSTSTISAPTFPRVSPKVLLANSFTIQLILDNREVRTKSDREYVQNNLIKAGVTPATRALQVGDALWVARNADHEVVLDYIVERKRLDDLLSSIKDGRFHEQKFRLTKSGIKNVVYIIEDYSLPPAADGSVQDVIDSAISSTQVVNGFFVKRTKMLDDTIKYLARMTRMLEDMYRGKDLFLIPDSHVESRTYPQLREHLATTYPGKNWYLSYDTFSTLVNKSASTTLRDLFLKMLMCVRGISAEKALEIQRVFGTPAELVEAYEKCADERERVDLVLNACNGAVRIRKIGAAVSRKVKEVWWGEDVNVD